MTRRTIVIVLLGCIFGMLTLWFLKELWIKKGQTENILGTWIRHLPESGPVSQQDVLTIGRKTIDERWWLADGISDSFGTPVRIEIAGGTVTLISAGLDKRFGTWDDYTVTGQVPNP
jgi:hypothetical protein